MKNMIMMFLMMVSLMAHASSADYNVRDYGAKGAGRAELAKREYREQGKNYPEAKFAKVTPAYGLFARHVDGLEVNNVTFRTMKPEYRPAAMLVDVKNEIITNLKADLQKGAKLIVKKK